MILNKAYASRKNFAKCKIQASLGDKRARHLA